VTHDQAVLLLGHTPAKSWPTPLVIAPAWTSVEVKHSYIQRIVSQGQGTGGGAARSRLSTGR
jgi:hypothetical protein